MPELADRRESHFPLRAGFCHDCTLVQIDHTIPKESMFSDYPYVSGTPKTLVRRCRQTAARLVERYGLKTSSSTSAATTARGCSSTSPSACAAAASPPQRWGNSASFDTLRMWSRSASSGFTTLSSIHLRAVPRPASASAEPVHTRRTTAAGHGISGAGAR
ncbi:class I SAM-dependent methyltransferase [Methylobacterium brachiatum]|uniref:class I SAM-dependent methyltransferase n=1 Tax=Methylobacterium brachiatum TaxID=269660 RepID=UPI001FDFDE77|nr:hypothetical protein [Methylobacterium brachiatum]